MVVVAFLVPAKPLWAQDCPPVNIWFLIDKSASIDAQELENALVIITDALRGWSSEVGDGTIWVGVGSFNEGYQANCPFGTFTDKTMSCFKDIRPTLGGTDILNALAMATDEFSVEGRFVNGQNIIILLSDGLIGAKSSLSESENIENYRDSLERKEPRFGFRSVDISSSPIQISIYPGGGEKIFPRSHNLAVLRGCDSSGLVVDGTDTSQLKKLMKEIKQLANCQ